MAILYVVYLLVAGWIVFQLVFPFLTVLAARLFGRERFSAKNVAPEGGSPPDFACVITAYRNAAIAKPLVESLLRQTYPHHTIYLVADECPEFDFGIAAERFVVLRPDPPLRLKVRSIIHALENLRHRHDYVVVFDADNLAHPQMLATLARYAGAGHRCIQARRTAKNLDGRFAAADALGEMYKNYIERYAPYRLGGSAVINGSGMATEIELYRSYLASPEIAQGQMQGKKMLQEDKILQNFLLRQDERIAYAWDAVCYDEKVATGDAVQTQRSRWLFSYFQNLPNALGLLRRGILRPSGNQFFFALVTMALPMFLQIGLTFLLALAGFWVAPWWSVAIVVAMGIFFLNLLWVLHLSKAPQPVWRALGATPGFIWRQALGLLGMGNPDKNFKPSEHTKMVSVDEVLEKH